ncbi:MAG: phage neck protein fibritin, partial [Treponema sp.]|nr:phage neck protein fibritin [Treponema sp.]
MAQVEYKRIAIRNDVKANWIQNNPVLLRGELGIEFIDDGSTRIKIGDGEKRWIDLEYTVNQKALEAALTEEAERATNAENTLAQAVSDNADAITEEAERATNAENTLAQAVSQKIPDAPTDSKQYVRKDGEWEEIHVNTETTLAEPTADETPPAAVTELTAIANILQISWNKMKYLYDFIANFITYVFDLSNWVTKLMENNASYKSIVYGNDKFVAVGNQAIAYSEDGIDWTTINTSYSNYEFISYLNGKFIIAGGLVIACSTDGINWKKIITTDGLYLSAAYGNGIFVTVGVFGNGNGLIAYSEDGIDWTYVEDLSGSYTSVVYGNGVFVAVSEYGEISRSEDGINWITLSMGYKQYYSVAYGNGVFVAVGSQVISYSANGINWTHVGDLSSYYQAVVYGNGV